MHLLEGIVHAHARRSSVRMRGHHADNATYARIQTRSDDAQDNVLAREDTSDLRMRFTKTWHVLHNTNSGDTTLLHQLRYLTDSRFGCDNGGLRPRIHDSGKIRQRGLLTESVNIGKHSSSLRVRSHSWTKLGLHTGKSVVEFLGGG